jgi:hypothetical protein
MPWVTTLPSTRKPMSCGSSPARHRSTPKKEWNSYLTDNNYSLSREEMLAKKKLFVSKNNVLSPEYTPPKVTSPKKKSKSSSNSSYTSNNSTPNKETPNKSKYSEDITSLDLLALSSDSDDESEESEEDNEVRYSRPQTNTNRVKNTGSSTNMTIRTFHVPTAHAADIQNSSSPTNVHMIDITNTNSPKKQHINRASAPSTPQSKVSTPTKVKSGKKSKKVIISTPTTNSSINDISTSSSTSSSSSAWKGIGEEVRVLIHELKEYELLVGKTSTFSSEVS